MRNRRRAERAAAFGLASLVLFGAWMYLADTERLLTDRSGRSVNSWANICDLIDGVAPAPFVGRRLLPDLARLLAGAVPAEIQNRFTTSVRRGSFPSFRVARRIFDRLNWNPDRYADLLSASLLIWMSLLGFMYAFVWLVEFYYHVSDRVATVLAIVVGLGLLGGYSQSWQAYPYDPPQVFAFLLSLYAIVTRRWWWPVAFVVAVYSKETSALLILAYAILRRTQFKAPGYWLVLAGMMAAVAGIRLFIHVHWNRPDAQSLWFPERNAVMLLKSFAYYFWFMPSLLVLIPRARAFYPSVPLDLRLLLIISVFLFAATFFKGILEERRDYFEIYPICALIAAQWTVVELNRPNVLRPRTS